MRTSELIVVTFRVILVWCVLSFSGWYFGAQILRLFLPLMEFVVRLAVEDVSPALSIVGHGESAEIKLDALIYRPLSLTSQRQLAAGTEFAVSHHVIHSLAPLIILFTLLMSWPTKTWRQRLNLYGLGILASSFVIAITSPLIMLGLLEIQLQETALKLNESRPNSWFLEWLYFCEMGGNWLIAIAAALACILLAKERFIYPAQPT